MKCFILCMHAFVVLIAEQCSAIISLDQVGQCKYSLFEKRIQNFNLENIGGELTNVYVTSEYQPNVVCDKEKFTLNKNDSTYNLVSNLVLQINGQKEKIIETFQVVPNSDGTYAITEYKSQNGRQIEQKHMLLPMFSGTSGGLIFYICNPNGTSANDLRSLALPTKGIAYRAYGISEMLQVDSSLGFSGNLRKLQRCQ